MAMKRYKAAARVLGLAVGEEFSSTEDERYAPIVEKGYLIEIGAEPASEPETTLGAPGGAEGDSGAKEDSGKPEKAAPAPKAKR